MHNALSEQKIACPYCGETITVCVEYLGEDAEYIEDCQVCCRPIVFHVIESIGGDVSVHVTSENDTF